MDCTVIEGNATNSTAIEKNAMDRTAIESTATDNINKTSKFIEEKITSTKVTSNSILENVTDTTDLQDNIVLDNRFLQVYDRIFFKQTILLNLVWCI